MAHSGNVVGTGVLLTLLGTACLAYGTHRVRGAVRRRSGTRPAAA